MTPTLSKFAQLRDNAWRYYDAVIWPSSPEVFDVLNPMPRKILNAELARIDTKEAKAGGTW